MSDGSTAEPDALHDLRRLLVVNDLRLSGHDTGLNLEPILRTLSAACRVPIAVVNIVTPGRQTYAAEIGLGAPCTDVADELSFCSTVVSTGLRLIVDDATKHVVYRDNPFVRDGSVRAYAGEPLHHRGVVVGSLAIFDPDVRRFSEVDLAVLHEQTLLAEVMLRHHYESRHEHADLLRSVVTNNQSLIYVKSLDGRYLAVNPAFERARGVTAEEIVGRTQSYLDPGLESEWQPKDFRALEGPYVLEEWTASPEGRRYYHSTRFPLRDVDGTTYAVCGVSVDVTATKEREEALAVARERERHTEQLQRTMLDSLSVSVTLTDMSGRTMIMNKAAQALFSLLRPGHVVTPLEIRTAAGDRIADDELPTLRTIKTHEPVHGAVIVATLPDGARRWLAVDTRLVPGADGDPVGVLSSYEDFTDGERTRQELAETARQLVVARDEAVAATRSKSDFLAAMSHEIRTPMNAVIGLTGLLLDTDLSVTQREFAETVRDSGDALLVIINDVLDFSRIESGELNLEQRQFDLRECVEGACALLAVGAAEKGIELIADLDEIAHESLIGDMNRLRQVIVNLVSNAVKFTTVGEVVVRASARAQITGPVQVEVSVRDTGIGIPADRMDRLFRSFSQVDSSRTRVFGGTGLGLAISRRLTEAMGGELSVTSEVDVGSTFTLAVPLGNATDRRLQRPAGERHAALRGRRALVVDDSATGRQVLQMVLVRLGMECTVAGSSDAALGLLATGPRFDVALLDMHMPGMGGLPLALAMRELPAGHALPLLLLTSPLDLLTPGERGHFAATLVKPPRLNLVRERLLAALSPGDALPDAPVSDIARRADELRVVNNRQLHILLAEDNKINQMVAQRVLEKLGHRVFTVNNGLEAVEAAQREAYDVVLMDVQMPILDGLRATARIRAELPASRQPAIVALTANALADDRVACARAGMDSFVGKPFRPEDLQLVLGQVILNQSSEY